MRIKRSVNALKKRRSILKQAKGYRGAKSKLYRVARQAVMKSGQYAKQKVIAEQNLNFIESLVKQL